MIVGCRAVSFLIDKPVIVVVACVSHDDDDDDDDEDDDDEQARSAADPLTNCVPLTDTKTTS